MALILELDQSEPVASLEFGGFRSMEKVTSYFATHLKLLYPKKKKVG